MGFLTMSLVFSFSHSRSFLPFFLGASQVVQQQKADCSQKLEGLTMWLAGAASMLANQRAGTESGDVSVLQQKQRELTVRLTGISPSCLIL